MPSSRRRSVSQRPRCVWTSTTGKAADPHAMLFGYEVAHGVVLPEPRAGGGEIAQALASGTTLRRSFPRR